MRRLVHTSHVTPTAVWIAACVALVCAACGGTTPDEPEIPDEPPFVASGDLAEIQQSGVLRVLLPTRESPDALPRGGEVLDLERELVEEYARLQGLEPHWVYVRTRSELIPSLLAGRGDLVAANLTVTEERRESVAFTVPLSFVREQLVGRAGEPPLASSAALAGRTIVARESSSFWGTLVRLREQVPDLRLVPAAEESDTDELIDRVARGLIDLTVADSNVLAETLTWRDDVRPLLDLSGDRPIAWALRPGSRALRRTLDHFLTNAQLARRDRGRDTGDLDRIAERKVLRVLTRNSASTYFLWRGELLGFEYELARAFADRHDLHVEIVVPPRAEDLVTWLAEGRGDLVAAGMTPTDTRREQVAFSRPYNTVSQIVVSRPDDTELRRVEDLDGRTVFVRHSSASRERLQSLRAQGIGLRLQTAPESLETEHLIGFVADGRYDLTVADSHILDVEMTWRDDVHGAFALGPPVELAWAVRRDNPQLLAAVNEFFDREHRGTFFNVIYRKYFKDSKRIRAHAESRYLRAGRLSPYDELARRYAERYGFDWRLIVAQMYQESRFDPTARSFAGAVGLMQVMPRTGAQWGISDLDNPEDNIHAGLRQLAWVRERFEPELPVQDRMWFTLAAYNVGHGHVRDARRLAGERGYDPDRWFGHVERAMLLLSRPEFARAARHGYCRGREPVQYVRKIRSRYNAYLETVESAGPSVALSLPHPG